MSKIKDLKKIESNNVNLITLFSTFIKSDKTKYIELFHKLLKNQFNNIMSREDIITNIEYNFSEIDREKFKDLSLLELFFISAITNSVESDQFKLFNVFCDFNERTLIENNDVTTYKSFEEILNEVNKVEMKLITNLSEKQVVTLFNDEEWVIIKPLTYESSKKYGSNTKWCTTSSQNPEYFYKYFRNGILIYCINRKTGYKIASYKALNEKEISFWDQKDNRIDSFNSELNGDIITLLRKEFKECKQSNYSFADPEILEKEMTKNNIIYRTPETRRNRIRVGNQFDNDVRDDPRAPEVEREESEGDGYMSGIIPLTNEDMINLLDLSSPQPLTRIIDLDDDETDQFPPLDVLYPGFRGQDITRNETWREQIDLDDLFNHNEDRG